MLFRKHCGKYTYSRIDVDYRVGVACFFQRVLVKFIAYFVVDL